MNSKKWKKEAIFAVAMGILTVLLCLVAADGMIGLDHPPARKHIEYMGAAIFWMGMIALPLIFHKWVKWRYTLLNLPLYFLLYFPIYDVFLLKHEHLFLDSGGFLPFPTFWGAITTAVVFWSLQSLVYLIVNLIFYAIKRRKLADHDG